MSEFESFTPSQLIAGSRRHVSIMSESGVYSFLAAVLTMSHFLLKASQTFLLSFTFNHVVTLKKRQVFIVSISRGNGGSVSYRSSRDNGVGFVRKCICLPLKSSFKWKIDLFSVGVDF